MEEKNNGDVEITFTDEVKASVRTVAEYTAPRFSLFFVAILALGAFFNESHAFPTAIGMLLWFVIQTAGSVLDDDYRNDIFWSILGTFGHLLLYVLFGHVWSYFKLYIDISQSHLDEAFMLTLKSCEDTSCFIAALLSIKTLIAQWTLTWPMSMLYTLTRDPLTILTNLLYRKSQERYAQVVRTALGTSSDVNDEWTLLWFVGGIVGYLVAGYIWTHIKLFLEVWQGTLSKKFDEQVRAVYEQDESYWQFIIDIKWLVMRWMLTWPFSVVYTLFRHPFRMVAEFVYELSQRKYAWITEKAMELRNKKEE
jgi:hypothetical protein